MAAPAYRATSFVTGTSASSAKFTVPEAAKSGDALLIWVFNDGASAMGLPTGGQTWTRLAETQGGDQRVAGFILPNWNGTDKEFTVSWTGSFYRAGAIQAYSGCDTTKAHDATSGENFRENGTTPATVDGLTTTVNECRLISCVFQDEGALIAPGSGWTERGDQADSPQVAEKNSSVEAGAQSGVTHTWQYSSGISMTLMVALRPPQEAVAKPNRLTLLGVG